ncbi:MAG TPA: PEP-CTERM sorting domain-containing protein [Urbifossiella sp.]|jgi:hypothetical protein|nr:PEP-CTERM sorting domain-containing protein [Urbifossiella sp.]
MRRVPGWICAVGVTLGLTAPGPARAGGVWVTLAAGLPGASAPSADAEVWFDSPHAPPLVALTSAPGTVVAGTDGGTSTFGSLGTPVLLNVGNGSAYLAGGGTPAPDAAKTLGPGGGSGGAGARSSVAPLTNATIPATAALLGITLADPTATGSHNLTVNLTDGSGGSLGTGTVSVPNGGWWVIGLGPDSVPSTPPPVTDPPPPTGSNPTPPTTTDPTPPVTTPPVTTPPTDPTGSPGPVATPEPSTLALVAVGGMIAGVARRVRGRKSA